MSKTYATVEAYIASLRNPTKKAYAIFYWLNAGGLESNRHFQKDGGTTARPAWLVNQHRPLDLSPKEAWKVRQTILAILATTAPEPQGESIDAPTVEIPAEAPSVAQDIPVQPPAPVFPNATPEPESIFDVIGAEMKRFIAANPEWTDVYEGRDDEDESHGAFRAAWSQWNAERSAREGTHPVVAEFIARVDADLVASSPTPAPTPATPSRSFPIYRDCPRCEGEGEIGSGPIDPDTGWPTETMLCEECDGTGQVEDRTEALIDEIIASEGYKIMMSIEGLRNFPALTARHDWGGFFQGTRQRINQFFSLIGFTKNWVEHDRIFEPDAIRYTRFIKLCITGEPVDFAEPEPTPPEVSPCTEHPLLEAYREAARDHHEPEETEAERQRRIDFAAQWCHHHVALSREHGVEYGWRCMTILERSLMTDFLGWMGFDRMWADERDPNEQPEPDEVRWARFIALCVTGSPVRFPVPPPVAFFDPVALIAQTATGYRDWLDNPNFDLGLDILRTAWNRLNAEECQIVIDSIGMATDLRPMKFEPSEWVTDRLKFYQFVLECVFGLHIFPGSRIEYPNPMLSIRSEPLTSTGNALASSRLLSK